MAKPIVLRTVSGTAVLNTAQYNANNQDIINNLSKMLSREGDGETNNELNGNIDFNGHGGVNVKTPSIAGDIVTKGYGDSNYGAAATTAAQGYADDAQASANAAEASATAAAASEAAAATSETNAATSETNAATSETNAATSETNAAASEAKAQQWAEESVDVEVETGKFSAKHWSAQAQEWIDTLIAVDYAELRAIDITSMPDDQLVSIAHRSTTGDGGGGSFYWDSSDLSTEVSIDINFGIYVAPNSDLTGASGAWVRQYSGAVNVKWFGAKGDGVTDDVNAFTTADGYGQLIIPSGVYHFESNITITGTLIFRDGVLKPATSVILTIEGDIDASPVKIFDYSGGGLVRGFLNLKGNGFVEWFGAVGDGVTDTSVEMQEAFDALPNIQLLPHTYNMNAATLTVQPVSGIFTRTILGAGINLTKITGNQTTQHILEVNGLNAGPRTDADSSWRISDLSIINTSVLTPTSGAGIYMSFSSYGVLERFKVEYCSDGLKINTLLHVTIKEGQIFYSKSSGIQVNLNTTDCLFDTILIDNKPDHITSAIGTARGLYLYCANTNDIQGRIEGCNFNNIRVLFSSFPLLVDGDSFTPRECSSYLLFTDCYFDTSSESSTIYKMRDCEFKGCSFGASEKTGLDIHEANNISFIGCTANVNSIHGVNVNSSVTFFRWQNGGCRDNSATSYNSFYGINIAANTTDFIIQGNVINNGMGLSNTQAVGVVVSSGASDRYIIADNLTNGALPNISAVVVDSGSGINKRVENNY